MKFTDLPIITNSSITDNYVFAVATNSTTDQLSLDELQKSFTGITARTTNGLSLIGKTVPSGITIGDNGFLGVNNSSPAIALDVGDNGGATEPEIRLSASDSSRQASYALTDASIYWKNTKKQSDTDYYIEVSEDDSNYTGVLNIDKNGNVGVFDGSYSIPNKFYVNGDAQFNSGGYSLTFNPYTKEITTNTDSIYLNSSNNYNVTLGNNVLYVENTAGNPLVGINNIAPSYPLDIGGSGVMLGLTNAVNNNTAMRFKNIGNTGYLFLTANGFSLGSANSIYTNGFFYNTSSKNLGIGTYSPANKLHVFHASQSRLVKFEINDDSLCEVFQVNNATSGPWHNLYTFGRCDSSENVAKWGIGLYDNDGGTYDDYFVFRVDASTSDSAIKARLDRNGNFDVGGSYTSKTGNYCRGKFVHTYQTRLTGSDTYFNPFYQDSSVLPSGSNDNGMPFGIAPFNGSVEKVQIFTSDQGVTSVPNPRLEFSVINPSNDTDADGYVSGFFLSPNTPATSLPVSGIVGQLPLTTVNTANTVYTFGKNLFSGVTNFNSGQLLQYRICKPGVGGTGGTQGTNIDYTVVSTISYTIT